MIRTYPNLAGYALRVIPSELSSAFLAKSFQSAVA